MEEDEKESDEVEINVGGDREAGRRREKRRERAEQDASDFHFICLHFFVKSVSKLRKWKIQDRGLGNVLNISIP